MTDAPKSDGNALRVRFAPSPTGYLHVGGARTALFNWLLARRHGGRFFLRIEDTDRSRSSDAMTRAIYEGLAWLGLDWDGEPVHQADGIARHRADALRLLEAGRAYRCFCTIAELDARRAEAEAAGGGYRYDRRCLALDRTESEARAAAGETFAVRFRVPEGATEWDDAVHGTIRFANADIEDFIILRGDGTPVYNMAVVSDDNDMAITLVIRGDDHISNTPKQILLYRALGAPEPRFAHVPMILGADGKRLSKRHGATAVGDFAREGILPQAMVNFLALLGWNPGTEEEILDADELAARFSLGGINLKSAIFDPQKLEWMNAQYISNMPAATLEALVTGELEAAGWVDPAAPPPRDWLLTLIEVLKPRARRMADFATHARPYLVETLDYDDAAVEKHWKDAETADRLRAMRDAFVAVAAWEAGPLEGALRETAERLGVKAGTLIHPLRLALTGVSVGPGIFDVVAVMGRERTLARLDVAIRVVKRSGPSES